MQLSAKTPLILCLGGIHTSNSFTLDVLTHMHLKVCVCFRSKWLAFRNSYSERLDLQYSYSELFAFRDAYSEWLAFQQPML